MTLALLPDQPSLDTFGAPKADFGESEDPGSEVAAEQYNGIAATLTALGFLVPRAWVSVSAAGALVSWGSVWGNTASPPVPAKTGTGAYTVTMPSSVPDTLNGTMRAFAVKASNVGINTSARVGNSRHTGNVLTVETYNVAGGAAADGALTVFVF